MTKKIKLDLDCVFFRAFKLVLLLLLFVNSAHATILAGRAKVIITPEIGEPSAGFLTRLGRGMEGVIQDLEANALYLDFGMKQYVFCSVDHLGILDTMHREIVERVKMHDQLKNAEIFISSSHTHSGPGGYIDLPVLGWMLAGKYDTKAVESTIESIASVIINSSKDLTEVKLGCGYGFTEGMTQIRNSVRGKLPPCEEISVIKLEKNNGELYSILFSYATHPYLIGTHCMKFSPDWIGYAREELKDKNGQDIAVLYVNGAQGDLACCRNKPMGEEMCSDYGRAIADKILEIAENIETSNEVEIKTQKYIYEFHPKVNDMPLPFLGDIESEINLIVINEKHAFLTIPGEMFASYDHLLKKEAKELGYENLTIFGITNGAHGYILPVKDWKNSTKKTTSFGGKSYGKKLMKKIMFLLFSNMPE